MVSQNDLNAALTASYQLMSYITKLISKTEHNWKSFRDSTSLSLCCDSLSLFHINKYLQNLYFTWSSELVKINENTTSWNWTSPDFILSIWSFKSVWTIRTNQTSPTSPATILIADTQILNPQLVNQIIKILFLMLSSVHF